MVCTITRKIYLKNSEKLTEFNCVKNVGLLVILQLNGLVGPKMYLA